MATSCQAIYAKELVAKHFSSIGVENPSNDVVQMLNDVALKLLENVEVRFEEYTKQYVKQLDEGKITPFDMKNTIVNTEDMLMKIFQEKCSLGIQNTGRALHRVALRKCHGMIVKKLLLDGTQILDEFLAEDVISIGDKDSIIAKDTQQKKIQELLSILEGRISLKDFTNTILPILKNDNPDVAEAIKKELQNTVNCPSEESRCPVCTMRDIVEVKRIALPLYDKHAISSSLYNDLRGSGLSNRQKWDELYKQFIDNKRIIESLRNKYGDLYEEFQIAGITTLECCCQPKENLPGIPDNDDDVDIANLMDVMEASCENQADTAYKMTARPCGMCLIINNIKFPTHVTIREGTDIDVKRLKYTFEKLEFSIQVRENVTASAMIQTMKDMAMVDHTSYDSFVCIFLSDCSNDNVTGVDDVNVPVSKLTAPFKASSCPSLAGKPKLFFIQSSRGTDLMRGFEIEGGNDEENVTIADEADFLIGYSTPPSYVSYRNVIKGTWFIMKLSEVLEKFGESQDLLSCLLMINNDMGQANASFKGGTYKQIPSHFFTLRKKVYFSSDPSWSRSLSTEFE